MAQLWCTGPAHIFVGATTQVGSPAYLGTAETRPTIEIRGEFEGVMNDIGGSRLPFDRLWQGEEAVISFVLTRWNMDVALRMISQPDSLSVQGLNAAGTIGTLMVQEGQDWPLWILFPYASKPAMAGMRLGYRFVSCALIAPKTIEPGTRAMKKHFVVQAMRSYNGANGAFTLYDDNMTGLTVN